VKSIEIVSKDTLTILTPIANEGLHQSDWKGKSVEEGVGASNTELISELGVVALGDNAGTTFSGSTQEGDQASVSASKE